MQRRRRRRRRGQIGVRGFVSIGRGGVARFTVSAGAGTLFKINMRIYFANYTAEPGALHVGTWALPGDCGISCAGPPRWRLRMIGTVRRLASCPEPALVYVGPSHKRTLPGRPHPPVMLWEFRPSCSARVRSGRLARRVGSAGPELTGLTSLLTPRRRTGAGRPRSPPRRRASPAVPAPCQWQIYGACRRRHL